MRHCSRFLLAVLLMLSASITNAQLTNWAVRTSIGDYDEYLMFGYSSCYEYAMPYQGNWAGYLECLTNPCTAGMAVKTTQNLGNVCYRSRVETGTLRGGIGLWGGIQTEAAMLCRRNYQLSFQNAPTQPIELQFYYTKAEIDGLINAFNSLYGTSKTYSDLRIIRYNGVNTDLTPANNALNNAGYAQIVPSINFYNYNGADYAYAQFFTSSYSEFYLGLLTPSRKLYVNDGSLSGDVLTTAIGNDLNSGAPNAPFATLTYAFSKAQAGDTIFIDAGSYDQLGATLLVNKAITVAGPNRLVSPNNASNTLQANASRLPEAVITNGTFVIGSNNISVEGLSFTPGPRSAIQLLNSSFGNFRSLKNRFSFAGYTGQSMCAINGAATANTAGITASGYSFLDNRFEVSGTSSGSALNLNYLKNVTVSNNAFANLSPGNRLMNAMIIGQSGVIDNITVSNNSAEALNYGVFSLYLSTAEFSNNRFFDCFNSFFIQTVYPGSSNIALLNNFVQTLLQANNVITARAFDGSLPGSTTRFRIEGNTVNMLSAGFSFSGTPITTQFSVPVLNPQLDILKNVINQAGNYAGYTSALAAISTNGKHAVTNITQNELNFTGTNYIPPSGGYDLSGILFGIDGLINAIPAGSTIAVNNNRISGYRNSIAFYDGSNTGGADSYIGYGNLPTGVVVQISNNSFTGDLFSINNGNIGQPVNASCNWHGITDAATVAGKMSNVIQQPFAVSGTDADAAVGFQPAAGVCTGVQNEFYVNDGSTVNDLYTTGLGNDNNPGTKAQPFATVTKAVAVANAGAIIYVDAGTYGEQIIITKGLRIKGAGASRTVIARNGDLVNAPNSADAAIIQTDANISDVFIDSLTVDGMNGTTTRTGPTEAILLQTGGGVRNCEIRNMQIQSPSSLEGNGIYQFYSGSSPRLSIISGNKISGIQWVGLSVQGAALSSIVQENEIDIAGQQYGMATFAGGWMGTLTSISFQNNIFKNYNGLGLSIDAASAAINNNSFSGVGNANAIIQTGPAINNAGCNWFGSADPAFVYSKVAGSVNFTNWLSSGTDNSSAIGFQPMANSCNGRQNKFYVNDAVTSGDYFTTAIGNNANRGLATSPFATIDYAYSKAQNGDTIFVDAGVYTVPSLSLGKSLVFLGPNNLISPNDASDKSLPNAARNTEAIITGEFTIAASGISFEGLSFSHTSAALFTLTNTSASNNDYGNFRFVKNRVITANAGNNYNLFNLTGKFVTAPAPPVTGNYWFHENRFEKTGTATNNCFNLNYLSGVGIVDNSFVAPGTTTRLQTVVAAGGTGAVSGLDVNGNTLRTQFGLLTGNRILSASANNNNAVNVDRVMNISPVTAESMSIVISNNILTNNNGTVPFFFFNHTGTSLPGSTTSLTVENNTISGQAIAGLPNQLPGNINFSAGNTVSGVSVTIRGNKIQYTGDASSVQTGFNRPITVRGNIASILIEKNELINNSTGVMLAGPANTPENPAITINSEIASNAYLPSNVNIQIKNNIFQGYKQSVVFYDPAAGKDPYIGYGNLPAGAQVNITNNSFTGDSISINNGSTGAIVTANCNWFGSSAAQNVNSKIGGTQVSLQTWLSSGGDASAATGFQPSGTCNGTPVLLTLDAAADVKCFGANNGSIQVSVSGGIAPYSFAWTKNDNAFAAIEDLTGLAAGTYHLTVTDALGTIEELEVGISEPDLLTANPGGSAVSCFGASDGSVTLLVDGGTAPYSYLWSNGSTTDALENMPAGIYSVTVTDSNGCTASGSYEVLQPALLTINLSASSTACSNSVVSFVSGGTAPYTYSWSNGASTTGISSVPAGTYILTVTDAHGCSATASATVTANEAFNPSASVTDVLCYGGATGSITVTNVNATAPFQYSIDGGLHFQTVASFNGLAAGTYTITVKDANGCTGFVTKTVTQPAVLLLTTGAVQNACYGSSNGSISMSISGGAPAYSYSWSGPGGYTSSQLSPSGLAAGIYTLTATDSRGCTAVKTVTVNSFNEIIVNSTVNNILCKGETNGSISVAVSGGSGNFAYLWNTGASTTSLQNLGTGNYALTITDIQTGCTVQRSYSITQPASLLGLSTTKTNATGCATLGIITASGSGGTSPYQYRLNNGLYTSSNSFTGLYAGSYTVWVRDNNGCTRSAVVAITDNGSDAFESNNSKNAARTVVIGANNAARLALPTDADWFKFTTPAGGGSYRITVTHPTDAYSVQLYSSANNAPALTPTGSGTGYKDYTLAGNSTYYFPVTGDTSYLCYQFAVTSNLSTRAAVPAEITSVNEKRFELQVAGNPSSHGFMVRALSSTEAPVSIRIFDAQGKLLARFDKVLVNQWVRFGERWTSGTYIAEVIQEDRRKQVRLIKL